MSFGIWWEEESDVGEGGTGNGRGREVKERVGWERERDPHNRHSQLVVSHPHMAF